MTSLDRAAPDQREEVMGFRSPIEFAQFQEWLAGAGEAGVVREVAVTSNYSGAMFEERWYRTGNGAVWRLVAPDPRFRGVFERVEEREL